MHHLQYLVTILSSSNISRPNGNWALPPNLPASHQSINGISTGFIYWLNQSGVARSSCQPGLWVHQERAASGHKQSSYVLPGSF